MKPGRARRRSRTFGISLIELILAMAISSLVILAGMHMAMAARNSFRLQEALAGLQENGRYFGSMLSAALSSSGFHPQPWLHESTPIGLMPGSMDAISPGSDRVSVRHWTQHNCFGTRNPLSDSTGLASYYLKESVIEMNNGSLSHTCRFGPDESSLVTQINRQGFIPRVEAFQALYAIDTNGDSQVDQWVNRNGWLMNQKVLALRVAMVTASEGPVVQARPAAMQVLDFAFSAPADGRLRRVFSYTFPLEG